jgi:hypothetical protein
VLSSPHTTNPEGEMRYPRDAEGKERHARPGVILLKRAMKYHGGGVDEFAREVLGRSRVSIWRWLRKATPIPRAVQDRLRVYNEEHRDRDPQPVRLSDV